MYAAGWSAFMFLFMSAPHERDSLMSVDSVVTWLELHERTRDTTLDSVGPSRRKLIFS